MIQIKSGVTPRLLVIAAALANAAEALALPFPVVITSGTDGPHMEGSKHYTGEALDVRTRNFASVRQLEQFLAVVTRKLGDDYQVIRESDHLHVEYDPRAGRTTAV